MTREEALNKAINIVAYFEAHFAKSKEAREDATNIIEALEQEQKSEWIPATCPPKENGKYLVTIHYSTHDFIEIVSYASNLYEVDEYDFADRKRPGWYDYGEYGFFEHDNVVAWRKLPEAYKEGEG